MNSKEKEGIMNEEARLSTQQLEELEKTTASFMKKAEAAGITAQELHAVIDANFVRAILKTKEKQDWYQDIVDFHVVMGHYIGEVPSLPSDSVQLLRRRLIKEEVIETLEALTSKDLVGIADGIADSIVVLLGTAVSYGIDIRPIWDEVHKTNMAKQGGGEDEYGKSLKPVGWKAPDIKSLLTEQGAEL